MLEYNKIYCGDNIELIKQLDNNCVDLTVTSPPYDNLRNYHGYSFDFENLAKELYRVTKDGGIIVWVVGDATINGSETGTSFKQALYFKEIGFNLHDTMIYEKPGSGLPHNDGRYGQQFEYMFIFSKNIPKYTSIERFEKQNQIKPTTRRAKTGVITKGTYNVGGGVLGNIWRICKNNEANWHPAVFPKELVIRHILSWSNTEDLVFDPFMGSGTVAKIAIQTNRNYVGFEISKEYCEKAQKDIELLLQITPKNINKII